MAASQLGAIGDLEGHEQRGARGGSEKAREIAARASAGIERGENDEPGVELGSERGAQAGGRTREGREIGRERGDDWGERARGSERVATMGDRERVRRGQRAGRS
uniref:Uncharacterized protein n=1 Tax=Knipowitschia caucasica TaxID=637954 RepID=A0AAV2L206_KNICA